MQEIISPYDYILLPVYLLLFFLIVVKKSRKYEKDGLRRIFITAFVLRMAGSVFYSLLIQYYYGYGDSFGYYQGGSVIADMIRQDNSSIKYLFSSGDVLANAARNLGFGDSIPVSMPNDSNAFIMKISAVLSFFTFNKYLLISICFGFFSFIGAWKLFYVFYQLNSKKNIKLLSFFVLYFPSLWFWGSGLLKEPVCIGALGIITYLFYKNFIEKKLSFWDLMILLFLLFILTTVKSYITILLLVSFFIILIYKMIRKIKSIVFRMVLVFCIFFTLVVTFITLDFSPYVKSFIEISFGQIVQLQKSYQETQAETEDNSMTFRLSGLSPSVESIISNSPAAIGTCLFRPFIWESKKLIIFLASLEAMFTLLVTLYVMLKVNFIRFFRYIFNDATLLFCLIFSILFALVVGYTTFNFGTLIRYKIIFLPFYYFILVSVYSKHQALKAQKNSIERIPV